MRRSTIAAIFVDTNVLVYNRDATEPDKQARASEWLTALGRSARGRTSVQVLSEYYTTMTRRFTGVFPVDRIRTDVRQLETWRPVPLTQGLIEDAWGLEDRFSLSWWDALVVAAARSAGCDRLLTEDLQHDLHIDGLIVTDPFRVSPEGILS